VMRALSVTLFALPSCRGMNLDGAHAFGVSAAAAFAASSISTVALHPLDTVKTRIQAGGSASVPWLGDPLHPGVSGLYRGVSMNVLKEAPDTACFLAISDSMSHSLTLSNPFFASHITLTLLLSGAVGDAVGSIFRLPAEVLCKRLQTSTSSAGWTDHLADTSSESWMTTWSAILLRDVPMGGLQIAIFHNARDLLGDTAATVTPDSFSDYLAGLLAGACAAALTTPLDVLVTHAATVPVASTSAETGGADSAPRSMHEIVAEPLHIGLRLVQEEGPMSLIKGIGCRTLYYAPTVGCFFGLYETFRRSLENSWLGGMTEQVYEEVGDAIGEVGGAIGEVAGAIGELGDLLVPAISSAGELLPVPLTELAAGLGGA